jgi:hypothetical protein
LATTSALDLFDAVSLTEAETHFENAIIVDADETKEPADGRRQTPGRVIPLVVHLASSTFTLSTGNRAQLRLDLVTVSQSSPTQQAGEHTRRFRP